MPSVLDKLGKGAHVCLLRLRSLGDCVLTTPAIWLLKNYRPDLRVGIAVDPPFRAIFEGHPDLDDILEPTPKAVFRYRAQLCVNLHGGTRSAWLTAASMAPVRAGFAHHRFSSLYNIRIPRAQQILGEERPVHTAEHLASAMFYLGVPPVEIPRAHLAAKPLHTSYPYAVLHPYASSADKTWPASHFLAIARHLQEHLALVPIFIGSPADDLSPFAREFRTSQTSLSETKNLLAGASFFLGNDSGPAHMAAAFGVPLVVLFATSNAVTWAPWRTPAEVVQANGSMEQLAVEQVLAAVDRLRVKAC